MNVALLRDERMEGGLEFGMETEDELFGEELRIVHGGNGVNLK